MKQNDKVSMARAILAQIGCTNLNEMTDAEIVDKVDRMLALAREAFRSAGLSAEEARTAFSLLGKAMKSEENTKN